MPVFDGLDRRLVVLRGRGRRLTLTHRPRQREETSTRDDCEAWPYGDPSYGYYRQSCVAKRPKRRHTTTHRPGVKCLPTLLLLPIAVWGGLTPLSHTAPPSGWPSEPALAVDDDLESLRQPSLRSTHYSSLPALAATPRTTNTAVTTTRAEPAFAVGGDSESPP